MRQIEYRIRKVITEADMFAAPRDKAFSVNTDSNLIVALEMDSLDAVELVMAIEDEFQLIIPDEVAESFTTIHETEVWLEKAGIENPFVQGYPDNQDPVIYLPAVTEQEPQRFVVLYDNALTTSGLDANVYSAKNDAQTFATTLKGRNISADVYKLVKV